MADNVTLPGTGAVVSAEEITTLNGAGVSAQQVQRVANALRTADGTAIDLPGDATNGLDVDVTRMPTDPFGANADAASASGSISAKLRQIATNGHPVAAAGDVAHDGGDSGNPIKVGAVAIAHGSNPAAVAAADRTNTYANRAGIPFVIGGHPNVISYGMSITTGVSNTVIGPTVNSGTILVVTAISFVLDNGSTVFPSVVIGFGATTTPAFATTPGTAKIVLGHPACPAGGGRQKGDGSGIVGIGGDGEELRITTVGTAGGNGLYVEFSGYTIES